MVVVVVGGCQPVEEVVVGGGLHDNDDADVTP